jgi:hypothetical protein
LQVDLRALVTSQLAAAISFTSGALMVKENAYSNLIAS